MEYRSRMRFAVMAGLGLVITAIVLFRDHPTEKETRSRAPSERRSASSAVSQGTEIRQDSFPRLRRLPGPPESAEEIVAAKLVQFSGNRRRLMNLLARRAGKTIPPEVDRYFDALERGHWEEAERIFAELHRRHENPAGPADEDLYAIWRPIQETEGIQSEARHWPAEQLLAYGSKVLGSLKPDMVFIGGTDPGAFINTFLNETSEGEQRIMFTQNALADSSYIDYLNAIYGERLQLPEKTDQDAALKRYIDDISSRAAHDRDFPDEPKQVRPGENLAVVDGKPQVSGQGAVMGINELLLNRLLELNPDKSFALEESASFKSTYLDAALLGPVMELRAGNESKLTPDSAAKAVEAWRSNTRELLDGTTETDAYPRQAWSHMAMAQANLLMERNFPAEAEEILLLARQLKPDNFEAVNRLIELYRSAGRERDAERVFAESESKQVGR